MSPLRLVGCEPPNIARWFDGGRLVAIPAKRGKRLPVLHWLVQEFEPGIYYSEADVNEALRAFHPDVAALRRYLVEEELMSRTPGGFSYWRSGGAVEFAW